MAASLDVGAGAMMAECAPKVLLVTKRLDRGGTERHIARIAPELRKFGIDPAIFALKRGGALEQSIEAADTPVFGPPGERHGAISAGLFLYRHIARQRPDVVHFFLPEPYLVGSFAAIAAGVRLRVMSRRSLAHYQQRHPIAAWFERRLHRGTTLLLANSAAVARELCAECGDPSKVGLIPNGIVVPDLSPTDRNAMRDALGLPSRAFVLCIVANLIGYKGHADLLAALGRIETRLPPDWRLIMAGRDDGIGAALRAQASQEGLDDHIVWAGERPDGDRLFAAADVAVVASHEEGFSNSLIEAMSYAVPVVATAVGGNLDSVADGETGFLAPARDPTALGEAIVRLANDPALRAKLGQAARKRAVLDYSLDACVRRYVALYTNLVRADRDLAAILARVPELLPPRTRQS